MVVLFLALDTEIVPVVLLDNLEFEIDYFPLVVYFDQHVVADVLGVDVVESM